MPIILIILGDVVAGDAVIILGISSIINIILSIAILETLNIKTNGRKALFSLVRNPLLIAILLGFLISFLQISLPQPITSTLELLSRIALPLILITIGISLSFAEIKKNWFLTSVGTSIKLLIMPLVAYIIMTYVFGVTGQLLAVVVLFAAMPTAISSYTFAKEFKSDAKLASTSISLSTLLSLITIPIIAILLGIV